MALQKGAADMISNFIVSVRDESLIATFRGYPGRLAAALLNAMQRITLKIQTVVKEEKLTGQVLHVRTGTLRRSINRRIWISGDQINGAVGTNVEYAGPHEFGFHGTVTVREHQRRIRARVDAKWAGKKKGKVIGIAHVKAFTRTMNLPERSFLRSSLRELEQFTANEIRRSAQGALRS